MTLILLKLRWYNVFSTSDESKLLLDKWIETQVVSQSGRADDRVLSLVFNSYKMLSNESNAITNRIFMVIGL